MARLVQKNTGFAVHLMPHHTIGRNESSVDTCINLPEISKTHAVIEWSGHAWLIKDLSRNGTWLDGKRLEPLQATFLKEGQQISFANNATDPWDIADLSPPDSRLISINNPAHSMVLEPYNLLPDENSPEYVLFHDASRGAWFYQSLADSSLPSQEATMLEHEDLFTFNKQVYRFFSPVNIDQTRADASQQVSLMDDCRINLDVSLDEENIDMSVLYNGQINRLGVKAQNYLLLYLARYRQSDAAKGLDPKDQGWVDNAVIAAELGIEDSYVNIQICRTRKLFSNALKDILKTENIIERRRGATRIGIESDKITIVKGEQTAISPNALSEPL